MINPYINRTLHYYVTSSLKSSVFGTCTSQHLLLMVLPTNKPRKSRLRITEKTNFLRDIILFYRLQQTTVPVFDYGFKSLHSAILCNQARCFPSVCRLRHAFITIPTVPAFRSAYCKTKIRTMASK